jgi:hypothetical protein
MKPNQHGNENQEIIIAPANALTLLTVIECAATEIRDGKVEKWITITAARTGKTNADRLWNVIIILASAAVTKTISMFTISVPEESSLKMENTIMKRQTNWTTSQHYASNATRQSKHGRLNWM